MKRILFFLVLTTLPLAPAHAHKTVSDRAQELIANIKSLFKKPAAQAPEAPAIFEEKNLSINVGYLAIKDAITEYSHYFTALKAFADNPEIDCILLDINSSGGSIATAEILAELIKNIQATKPVICFISDMGCSAAYLIASAASYIIAPESAQIGNIGAIMTFSLDKNVTHIFITSGKHKAPLYKNKTELDEEDRKYRQEYIDKLAEVFFSKVATSRNLSIETIKNLHAKMFLGNDSLAHGLIDQIGTHNEVIKKITTAIETKNNCVYNKVVFIQADNTILTTFNTIH